MEETVQKYTLAYKDYKAGVKYKDIAVKYGVSITTVKKWYARYWRDKKETESTAGDMRETNSRQDNIDKGNSIINDSELPIPVKREVSLTDIQEVLSDKAYQDLEEKQRQFVDDYIFTKNARQSYLKVYKCSPGSASELGTRLLKRVDIARIIEIKQAERASKAHVDLEFSLEKAKSILARCMQAEPVMTFNKQDKRYEVVRDDNGCAVYQFDSKGALGALDLIAKITGQNVIKQQIDIHQTIDDQTTEQNKARFKELMAKIEANTIDV